MSEPARECIGAAAEQARSLLGPLGQLLLALTVMVCLTVAPPRARGQAPTPDPEGVTAGDLFAPRDVGAVGSAMRARWLPPSAEYIAAHTAPPELATMGAEFELWARALLAPRWLPPTPLRSAMYLKQGTGRESRALSYFYVAGSVSGTAVMVKGHLDRTEATIRPPAVGAVEPVLSAFAEAAALSGDRPPGAFGAPMAYQDPSRDLQVFLRQIAERYIAPSALPRTEEEWAEVLGATQVHNSGFWLNWVTTGYTSSLPADAPPGPRESALCVLWTNGRVLRLVIDHHLTVYPISEFLATFPPPRKPSTAPLNPECVELWDMADWRGPDGPVDDVTRATRLVLKVVTRPPHAGPDAAGEGTGSASATHEEVRLPLTDTKWHIAESAALLIAASAAAWPAAYPETFAADLGRAVDRGQFLAEAESKRALYASIVGWFAARAYPPEAAAEKDHLLRDLQAGLAAWDNALEVWRPTVRYYPDASATFYELRGQALDERLAAAGLSRAGARAGQTAAAAYADLFRRFGLQP